MTDVEAHEGLGQRLPWEAPRIVMMTPARDNETNNNIGPEILIITS